MTDAPGTMVLLTRLSRAVYRRATEEVIGMRLKEFAALLKLRDLPGGVGQRQLGEHMLLDANSCVILLNGIEERGWAKRERDATDRRRHIVVITPEGERALDHAERKLDGLEDQVLGPLEADERRQLRDLLARALAAAPVPT